MYARVPVEELSILFKSANQGKRQPELCKRERMNENEISFGS